MLLLNLNRTLGEDDCLLLECKKNPIDIALVTDDTFLGAADFVVRMYRNSLCPLIAPASPWLPIFHVVFSDPQPI